VDALQARQKDTLVKVLWVNAAMFLVIAAAAFYGQSAALFSDSLDNLGDALTYGLSLYAVSRSAQVKARIALVKGGLIFLGASFVVGQIVWKLVHPVVPSYEVMGVFSLLGLGANGLCLWLLWRHRAEDINMRSVYECSRNDIASNLSVFLAAGGVWLFASGWPDIVVAAGLAVLLLRSSGRVLRGAMRELGA
jgi:Co/Zn/Cd efflux system component